MILLISASQVAKIIGVSHLHPSEKQLSVEGLLLNTKEELLFRA
jgi:hypothetical protein